MYVGPMNSQWPGWLNCFMDADDMICGALDAAPAAAAATTATT